MYSLWASGVDFYQKKIREGTCWTIFFIKVPILSFCRNDWTFPASCLCSFFLHLTDRSILWNLIWRFLMQALSGQLSAFCTSLYVVPLYLPEANAVTWKLTFSDWFLLLKVFTKNVFSWIFLHFIFQKKENNNKKKPEWHRANVCRLKSSFITRYHHF